jgi:hypothetical protein
LSLTQHRFQKSECEASQADLGVRTSMSASRGIRCINFCLAGEIHDIVRSLVIRRCSWIFVILATTGCCCQATMLRTRCRVARPSRRPSVHERAWRRLLTLHVCIGVAALSTRGFQGYLRDLRAGYGARVMVHDVGVVDRTTRAWLLGIEGLS